MSLNFGFTHWAMASCQHSGREVEGRGHGAQQNHVRHPRVAEPFRHPHRIDVGQAAESLSEPVLGIRRVRGLPRGNGDGNDRLAGHDREAVRGEEAGKSQGLDPLQGDEHLRRAFRHQRAEDLFSEADLGDHRAAPLRHAVDLVGLHVVAPDECGPRGDLRGKEDALPSDAHHHDARGLTHGTPPRRQWRLPLPCRPSRTARIRRREARSRGSRRSPTRWRGIPASGTPCTSCTAPGPPGAPARRVFFVCSGQGERATMSHGSSDSSAVPMTSMVAFRS